MSSENFASPGVLYAGIDVAGGGGSGDVTGPVSSTDLHVPLFNGTTGKIIQNSVVEVKDNRMKINGNTVGFSCMHEVAVFTMADFPAPVAGVITLAPFITYDLKNSISTADRFVIPAGVTTIKSCVFSGQTTFTYTGGFGTDFFTSTSTAEIFFTNLKFRAVPGGDFINSTSANSSYSISYCIFEGWSSFGSISNAEIFGMNRNVFTDTNRMSLTNCEDITIDTCKWTETGTNTFSRIFLTGTSFGSIRNQIFDVTPNNVLFDVSNANTGIIKITGTTRNNSNGDFFDSSGQDHKSPLVLCKMNDFQPDSKVFGAAHAINNAVSESVTNVWEDFNLGTLAVVSSSVQRFTLEDSTTGEMKYTGLQDFTGKLECSFFCDSTAGPTLFHFKAVKNGLDLADGIEASNEITGIGDTTIILTPISLVTGDLVRMQMQTDSGTDTITIVNYSMIIN